MNLLCNISQVFPVDLYWMISHVPVATRLLILSQASTDTRLSASRVGACTEPRVSCVCLLLCLSACETQWGRRAEGAGGSELCPEPGHWHQAAEQMAFDECARRTCHVLRLQREGVGGWCEVSWWWCVVLITQPSAHHSHTASPSALFFSFFFWFRKNKLEHIMRKLS